MTVESREKLCKGGEGKNKEECKNKQTKPANKQTKNPLKQGVYNRSLKLTL